ncbi:MAG: hypothetical protein JW863_23075 [Chitinispirillaceae bacterium]|nr:hypothetical protein [Chitinispirillaceae bacterium]
MHRESVGLLTFIVLLCSCTQPPVGSGGGASETVATVTPYEQGLQVSVSGDGSFSVQAAVYHSDYTATDTTHFRDTSILTNDVSEWSLGVLSDSVFIVYVMDAAHGKGAAFRYDNRPDSSRGSQTKKLTAFGGITGIVTITSLETGDTTVPVGERIVVPGSSFSTIVGDGGEYRLSGLPEATYTIRIAIERKIYIRNGPADTVTVSGDRISTFDLHLTN